MDILDTILPGSSYLEPYGLKGVYQICLVALLILVFILSRRLVSPTRVKKTGCLLLGECNAGKTALFYALRGSQPKLVSSLKPNIDTFPVADLEPIKFIDFPGHRRFAHEAHDYAKTARCILFLIDAKDKSKLKDAAESLYGLFTLVNDVTILLCVNKTDVPGARTEKQVVDELEREIERMRTSRAAALEGEDVAETYLGIDGEAFKMSHAAARVEITSCSVEKEDIVGVLDFLQAEFD